ncbi:DUF2752 domain-containing protein [Nocardia farcinica]|uniref:Protein of uncharacterized function (DUF2752) n=1 Tax=Nocardia farcinica TaxID=37329 RepID=A0A0H5NXK7_NOCFR|nr:DUF2752 domain-containing protein [Nocardia farcinica]AXK86860.1 DUF2752 domain-containing protein [Nocardia farcinica]MBF6360809.1 DUF2752 domain-containing protein [Nocardia farcinica]MBF6386870.1 DUF2752 domain-containing protein [Nocardia farcinica]MBF6421721.1 DUF2752 domain-containing protein [Nocardia farcinica]MBF6433378.1 DUF2752 domain-containing protein [Nocardia farcinica]
MGYPAAIPSAADRYRVESSAAASGALAPVGAARLPWVLVDTPVDHQAPRPVQRGGLRALGLPMLTAAAGAGVLVLLHVRDPHVEGSYGECPVYALFGVYCPGCGGMRAVHNLTDGRVLDSLHSNLLALPLIVAFFWFVADWSVRAWRGQKPRVPAIDRSVMWALFALFAVYAVLRNTPWGTWLTPV